MTVSTEVSSVSYDGDNVTLKYPIPFYFLLDTDLLVSRVNVDGTELVLALGSDYTVTGAGDEEGGELTLAAPIPLTIRLLIDRDPPVTQETAYQANDPFPAKEHEKALDKLTMLLQRVSRTFFNAIHYPLFESIDGTLPRRSERLGMLMGFNITTGKHEMVPYPNSVGAGDRIVYRLVSGVDFAPGATSVTLPRAPGAPGNLEVFWDAAPQSPITWSVNGTTLNFSTAIPNYITEIWGYIGTTLSQQIPPPDSVGDDQILWDTILARQVASVAEMMDLDVSRYQIAYMRGYYGTGSEGGGIVYYDAADNATPIDNGLVFGSNTGAGRWKRPTRGEYTFCDFGCVGDGVTDDSARAQIAINSMRGKRIDRNIGKTFLVAGLTLIGSTYNNTIIGGQGLFKLKPDGGASNFGGGWVGLLIKDCDGVVTYPNWDGNRTAMTQREQIICEGIAGASNWTQRDPMFSQTRGDCIYIGQSNWQASSANSQRGVIEFVQHVNTALDGRNTISIISCVGLTIHGMKAQNSGGLVNGFLMPGGIDIEPDQGYEICSDIRIGPTEITTGGTSGLGIFGKSISGNDANLDWNCFDIEIGPARIQKFGTTGSALSAGPFVRCADVYLEDFYISYEGGVRGNGPVFDFCQRIRGKVRAMNVTNGVVIGPVGNANQLELEVTAANFSNAVVRSTSATNGTVRVKANGAVSGAVAAVQFDNAGRAGLTQQNMTYEVHAPYDGNLTRAMHNEPANPIIFGPGCIAQNGNWAGYPSGVGANTATIRTKNNSGWDNQNAMPTVGAWTQGTFVSNDLVSQAAPGAGKMLIGWSRLNTGSNNALNTDWSNVVVTIS